MDRTPHVYLIPGFLGFANLGRIAYFGHVRRILATRLAAAGLDARIHIVHTPPTASLPRRAARVAATIAATARARRSDPSDRSLERRARRAPVHCAGGRVADVARRGAIGGARAQRRHDRDAAPRNTARVVLHDAARPTVAAAALAPHDLHAAFRAPPARRVAVDGKPLRPPRRPLREQRSSSTRSSDASSRTSRRHDVARCGRC